MLPFYVDFDLPPESALPRPLLDLMHAEGSRELLDAWPGDRDWMAGLSEPQRRAVASGARNIAIKLLEAPLDSAPSRNILWIRGRTQPSMADELATSAIEAATLLLGEGEAALIVLAVGPNAGELFLTGSAGGIVEPTQLAEVAYARGRPRLVLLDQAFHGHIADRPAWLSELAETLEGGSLLAGTGSGVAERDLECLALEAVGARAPRWKNAGFGWHFLPQRLTPTADADLDQVVEIAQLRRRLGPSLGGRSGAMFYARDHLLVGGFSSQAIDMETRALALIKGRPGTSTVDVQLLDQIAELPSGEELERMRPARIARMVADAHATVGQFTRAA